MKELPIPPIAAADNDAMEIARVWIAQKNVQVILASQIWEDTAAWGLLLVDLAKHIANAFEQTRGEEYQSVLQRIREGFDAEWATATSQVTGGLME